MVVLGEITPTTIAASGATMPTLHVSLIMIDPLFSLSSIRLYGLDLRGL
jgi:hypothetical protein